jgi:ABC-type antimicrobial peptide transport system permease subunit
MAIGIALRQALPEVSLGLQTIEAAGADDRQFNRQLASLIGVLAALAVGLAMMGLYGVVSFSVKQRTKEIGVRLALGAARRDIYAVVARRYASSIFKGLIAGVAMAVPVEVIVTRVLGTGFSLFDHASPWLYGLAALTMVGACALAIAGPAMRAAEGDPLSALRSE